MLKKQQGLKIRFDIDFNISVHRFSAIQCAAAVPRALAESSSSEKFEQSHLQISSEIQANNALTTNGHGPPNSKQISQQPKGIMGMFTSKAASKTQDTNKETKIETKEVTNMSSLKLCLYSSEWVTRKALIVPVVEVYLHKVLTFSFNFYTLL